MKKLPGVLLFLILALVILDILILRELSRTIKRMDALEKKVEALSVVPAPSTEPAPAHTLPPSQTR